LILLNLVVNLTVDWGDGNSDVITTWNQAELIHGYASSGTYQVTLNGSFDSLNFYQNDAAKLMSIDNWGTNKWQTGTGSFRTCVNMVANYSDNPDFSEITSMNTMFLDCINFDGALNFDIPLCITLQQTFLGCDSLNSDITITNSSNVLTTFQMFANADLFNGNLSISDTSNVNNMDRMFERCFAFNKPINFDTSSCTNMFRMFSRCTNFNQPLSFDTANVLRMDGMFEVCTNLNSSITFTDTSNVTRMDSMFSSCTNFNQPVSFDTVSVSNMQSMFQNCTNFNQPVNFNTSNVNTMFAMFQGCINFNQPVNFDTSSVTSMQQMFYLCSAFNQIINFTTSSLTNTYRMMRNCVAFNSSFTLSDTSAVINMQEMFFNAINFNEDISSFNISSLTYATSMLQSSAFSQTNYDLLLPAWDAYGTSGVTFHAGTAQYTAAPSAPATAHANMLGRGWTITDGGPI
jgi:surface protein